MLSVVGVMAAFILSYQRISQRVVPISLDKHLDPKRSVPECIRKPIATYHFPEGSGPLSPLLIRPSKFIYYGFRVMRVTKQFIQAYHGHMSLTNSFLDIHHISNYDIIK